MSENGSEKEEVLNLVALGALKDESNTSADTYSDTEVEIDSEKEYHVLYGKWLKLKDENMRLLQDLVQSRKHGVAQKARQEQSKLVDELAAGKENNKSLIQEVSKLREAATGEQERARMLKRDLVENHTKIPMINSGSKNLEHILSMGQSARVNRGLEYRGAGGTVKVHQKGLSHFLGGKNIKR